jgi:hypothetical protein
VPGAWAGSSTSMSIDRYSGASPTRSRIRATTPFQDGQADRAALIGALSVAAGFSRPFAGGSAAGGSSADGSAVAVARREARWALAQALEAGRAVISYGEDRTEKWLTSEPADLRALAAQVLGPDRGAGRSMAGHARHGGRALGLACAGELRS